MDERREKERIPIETESQTNEFGTGGIFGVTNLETDRLIGHMKDISSDGFQLKSWNPIREGAILCLRLRLPERIADNLYVVFDVECQWCANGTDDPSYFAGFKICYITPSNRKRMDLLLQSLGKNKTTAKG